MNLANQLASRALALYDAGKLNGTIRRVSEPFRVTTPHSIIYSHGGDSAVQSGTQLDNRATDYLGDLMRVGCNELVISPEAVEFANHLIAKFGIPKGEMEPRMQNLGNLLMRAASDHRNRDALTNLIDRFVSEVAGLPQMWKASIELEGLWLSSDVVETSEFTLRRPTVADLTIEEPLNWVMPRPLFVLTPPAFMEVSVTGTAAIAVQEKAHQILNVLLLYKLGSIKQKGMKWIEGGTTWAGGQTWSNDMTRGRYRFEINQKDSRVIDGFFLRRSDLIKRVARPMINSENEALHPLMVAFERYKETVNGTFSFEEEVAKAVSCLEALYLDGPNTELKFRLSMRVAALLRCVGESGAEIAEIVGSAYDIRSAHVHGSLVKEEKRNKMPKLGENILEYARKSLNIFISLIDSVGKKKLIEMVDESLLDEKAYPRLREIVAGAMV